MSSWNPWAAPAPQRKEDTLFGDAYTSLASRVAALPAPTLAASAFAAGVLATLGVSFAYKRNFKRITNVEWITPDIYARKQWIKGRVVSVGDADNFRVYHTPGIGWRWPLKFRTVPSSPKDLKDNTIHIRMAGVDAPEGAHFGRPAQEYFQESLDWLKGQVLGKIVYCQVLRRDQYSRVVAMPYLKPRFLPGSLFRGKCISVEMLRAGWVVTYEQAGAEYGPYSKEQFLEIQKEAEITRRGIWAGGALKETPAAYKKKYANSTEAAELAEPASVSTPRAASRTRAKKGFLRKLEDFLKGAR